MFIASPDQIGRNGIIRGICGGQSAQPANWLGPTTTPPSATHACPPALLTARIWLYSMRNGQPDALTQTASLPVTGHGRSPCNHGITSLASQPRASDSGVGGIGGASEAGVNERYSCKSPIASVTPPRSAARNRRSQAPGSGAPYRAGVTSAPERSECRVPPRRNRPESMPASVSNQAQQPATAAALTAPRAKKNRACVATRVCMHGIPMSRKTVAIPGNDARFAMTLDRYNNTGSQARCRPGPNHTMCGGGAGLTQGLLPDPGSFAGRADLGHQKSILRSAIASSPGLRRRVDAAWPDWSWCAAAGHGESLHPHNHTAACWPLAGAIHVWVAREPRPAPP